MIKLQELRHENWVIFEGLPKQIDNHTIAIHAQDFEPIPLTVELLLANGLKWCCFDGLGFKDILIRQNDEGKLFYYPNRLGIELTSVHQLQNLIMCLTGKEWEVKL